MPRRRAPLRSHQTHAPTTARAAPALGFPQHPCNTPRRTRSLPGYLNLHGELPGLVGHLRTHLQRIITRRLVEPHRRYLDLQRIYRNKHLQRVRALQWVSAKSRIAYQGCRG